MRTAAADAWMALAGSRPDRIDVLKQRRGTFVYRLHGVGDAGFVIAKRTSRTTATIERIVYENLLPKLGLPKLRYYGVIEEPNGSWLFVEEATGARFHPDKNPHRMAAARWLGELHGSLRGTTAPAGLPSRRVSHYQNLLQTVREALAREPKGAAPGALAAQCDRLSACWPELEAACASAPETLVHGDLVAHNVCVHEGAAGLDFLPFDWEKAGWGAAAEDISVADLEVYAATLGAPCDTALRRLAGSGRVFRCLVFLEWVLPTLADDRQTALEKIGLCTSWLEQLMERAPWRR